MPTIISLERIQGLVSTAPESILPSFIDEFTTILGSNEHMYIIREISETNAEFNAEFKKCWCISGIVRNAIGQEMIKNLVEEEWDFTKRPIALLKSLSKQKKDSAKAAFTTWKTLEAFYRVFKISNLEHNSSVSQMSIQLETKRSIAEISRRPTLTETNIQKIIESIDETRALGSKSLSARSDASREEAKAKELFYSLKREAQLIKERYHTAKLRAVLGKPNSDSWHRLSVEVREIVLKMALRSEQTEEIRQYPFLDPTLRTWMLTKDTMSQASSILYRYAKFSFTHPFMIRHPMMHTMTEVQINCQYNRENWISIDSLDCTCNQSLVKDELLWFIWLRHCAALQKLEIITGRYQTIRKGTLKRMPSFNLPSSLREVSVIYKDKEDPQCNRDQHESRHQHGKKIYKVLTDFLAIRLRSWNKEVLSSEISKTVFRRQSNNETH